MDLETTQTTTTAKLPILKQENGKSFIPAAQTTTNAYGTSTTLIPGPVTTKEEVQKKNDVKARSILLMALPNEHLMTFNPYKDAKTLFAAIQIRFGANKATKKTQKTLLKQMYENFNAPSTESLDSIFDKLQKIVNQLAILGKNISHEDFNLKFLRILHSEWNTHVVVWRNKPNLDTISTNEVNTTYGVSNANTQISPTSTQVSTVSTQVSTANLSDATVYAFMASQPNGKITINGSDTAGYNKSKVDCFNYHKLGHFTRECRQLRNQDSMNRNQGSSRRTVNVEETTFKVMVAIDEASFDWSYMTDDEVPTNMALMAFFDSELDLSNSGLEEFQQPEFEGYGPKTSNSVSEDIFNEVKESPNAPLVKELVLDDKLEKKTVYPSVAKIEFANCNYHQKEMVVSWNNYTRVNYNYSTKKAHPSDHKNMDPRAILKKTGLRPVNTARPANTAHLKTTVYSAKAMPPFSKLVQSTGNLPFELQEKGVIGSGCSRYMTGNMSYLSEYEKIDGGYVAFGGDPKEVKSLVKEMNQFCKEKGIKREFSVARTLQ
uniref:Ribonuclease H-like domain-containing protein n=1 Tax=Tanacetum cinerariifolium TaxID=118510 RepID=A0A6L2MYA2_TANCI|nr:ribonuclease H-like domain-containing protein [Tanacetum cinerariifolium]